MSSQNARNADQSDKYSVENIVKVLGGREQSRKTFEMCLKLVEAGFFDHITFDDAVEVDWEPKNG